MATPRRCWTASLIDEIVREGARRMLAAALEAEVNAYIAELADERDDKGRRLVVRNGYHQPRQVTTAAGAVEVKAPRLKRQARRRGHGRAQAVLLRDPAALVPQEPEDQRGSSAALLARPVLGRLRARAGAVPWKLGRAVPCHGHPADDAVAGRQRRLHGPRPRRGRLRVFVGRRHPPQRQLVARPATVAA